MPLGLAALVSAAVSLLAFGARTLTLSGAAAATIVGTLILHGSGWQGGAVLAAFFISSNLVSRLGVSLPAGLDPKGDRRDGWQVIANGGAAAIAAALSSSSSAAIWPVTAALAAAAADTWATSVGIRSRVPPRLLWFGPPVPAGTGGGVTAVGSAGALAGATIVATIGALAAGSPALLPIGTLIGFLGMAADSAAGAFLQGRFHCPRCDQASEWPVHRCGAPTTRTGGVAWLNNDGVNLVATALAGGAGWAAWELVHG